MSANTDTLNYRIQAAGLNANELADILYAIAEDIDGGATSGFHQGMSDWGAIAPTTRLEPLTTTAPLTALVEIDETTHERIAFTLGCIANMVGDGLTGGQDTHDEGGYNFSVTGR